MDDEFDDKESDNDSDGSYSDGSAIHNIELTKQLVDSARANRCNQQHSDT